MNKRLLSCAVGFLLVTAHFLAYAQTRVFPEKTILGKLELGNYPLAQLDGKDTRFAPGGRIINTDNTSVTPMTVQGRVQVLYLLDTMGQIQRVWLLTKDEITAAEQREVERKAAARANAAQ